MPPIRRAVTLIAILTALAGAFMHMQAQALGRVVAEKQLRVARATAMSLGSDELARAESEVRAGRSAAGARHVDTQQGRLRVETVTERQAAHRQTVRVRVADESGRVLSRYETVVEVERR
jgi:hypothetical protein